MESIVNDLLKTVEELKVGGVKNLIDRRIKEFKENKNIFSELCFCILTANFNAERAIKIQNIVGNGFSDFDEKKIVSELRQLGHRFPYIRAKYIIEARKHKDILKNKIENLNGNELREWLVKNVKGLGWKESSHFLRNIGYGDFAIIDFHILDLLVKYKIIEKPKSLIKKKYLEIEEKLREIGKRLNLDLNKLDLYLWYMETGKVLK